MPDGGRAATLPEAPPSQGRPGRGARFRTTVLCPGRAARPLLSGRKAGKAHRDTCRGRHGLSGSCEGTAAQGCLGARRPRGIPFATDRRAGAEARHPLGSSFGLSPLSSMAVTARVRGVAVDVGICEAFAVPWTALRMDAFVPLCPLYRGAVEERYVILEYLHPGLLPSGHRRAFAQGSGHGRFGSGRPAGAVAFSAPAALGPSAFSCLLYTSGCV